MNRCLSNRYIIITMKIVSTLISRAVFRFFVVLESYLPIDLVIQEICHLQQVVLRVLYLLTSSEERCKYNNAIDKTIRLAKQYFEPSIVWTMPYRHLHNQFVCVGPPFYFVHCLCKPIHLARGENSHVGLQGRIITKEFENYSCYIKLTGWLLVFCPKGCVVR